MRVDGKRTAVEETHWVSGTARTADYTWTYDDAGRLTQEKYDDDHDNSLDYEAFYTYDLTGNRLKKEVDTDLNTTIDETTTYTYNAADQLLTETKIVGAVDSSVAVDDTYTVYTYDGTLQTGKAVYMKYDYDNVSGTSPTTETTNEYNLQGRLSKVIIDVYSGGNISSQEITEFKYDHQGNRVEARHTEDTNYDGSLETDETTTYLNDSQNHTGYNQVLEEVTYDNLAEAEIDRRIYTLGHDIIAQFTKNSTYTSGTNTIFHYDGHGSTRILTDLTGAIATLNSIKQIFKYDAYGNALTFNFDDALTSLLYSGEWTDANIGQQYLRARFYDMETGTFNRLDPFFGNMKDPQSFHKYLYTHADPVNGIDPTGMWTYVGVLSAITIVGTLGSIALPVIGGAYLAVSGGLSITNVGNLLISKETWFEAAYALGIGMAINGFMQALIIKLAGEFVKKVTPITGALYAIGSLKDSIKLTYNMVSSKMPQKDAEKYVAVMIASSILSLLLEKFLIRYAKQKQDGEISEDDFLSMTAEDRANYELGQMSLPNKVYKEYAHLDPVARGKGIRGEYNSARRRVGLNIRGYLERITDSFRGNPDGPGIIMHAKSGLTPSGRYIFGTHGNTALAAGQYALQLTSTFLYYNDSE